MTDFEFSGEREATIRLTDTATDQMMPPGAPPIPDFDSELTDMARNSTWKDLKSPIGQWPETGNYGAVLLAELREEQKRILGVYEQFDRSHLPDAQVLERSLSRSVIGLINWAPRNEGHHENGQNGEDFYLAELENNVLLFSQLPFLEGVATRGLVRGLYRIRDDNPVWPNGEQYRSSIVSHLRNFPEFMEEQPLDILPKPGGALLRLAYADKYGNGRIEKSAEAEIPEIEVGKKLLIVADGKEIPAVGASRITDIPQDQIGIYANPADSKKTGPSYLEMLRRVNDPNDPRSSAYETLRSAVMPEGSTQHPDWSQIELELAA